jgi:hypothetical protein
MVDVAFDEPNLVADAGLVPLLALAEQVGLPALVAEHVAIVDADNSAGANAPAKVMSLVAGMAAGADSIEDIDRLRQTGNRLVFAEMQAPSTVGTFLRAFTHGHVQQLNAVLRASLATLAHRWTCCLAPTRWCSLIWTPPTGRCTGTPSRAPSTAG